MQSNPNKGLGQFDHIYEEAKADARRNLQAELDKLELAELMEEAREHALTAEEARWPENWGDNHAGSESERMVPEGEGH